MRRSETGAGAAMEAHICVLFAVATRFCCAGGYEGFMRGRFEFQFHHTEAAEGQHVDAKLALLGSQGWELCGIAPASAGGFVVALQRPLDEEIPLAEPAAIALTLEEPLTPPGPEELELR